MNSIFEQPGRTALTKYRESKSGMELFRAYIERRDADKQLNGEKRKHLTDQFPRPGEGIPTHDFEEVTTELLRLDILDELDPIIRDLLTFCGNQPPGDDQLANLRSALRIGKGCAPIDVKLIKTGREIQAQWIAAYGAMQNCRQYRSFHDIAKEIAGKAGVAVMTAKKYWKELIAREPWQAKWAEEIEWMAKKPQRSKPATATTSAKGKRKASKPECWR